MGSTNRAMAPIISYAQRYEDMHLLRVFGEQTSGFYIDIGANHLHLIPIQI